MVHLKFNIINFLRDYIRSFGYTVTLEKISIMSVLINVEGRQIPRDDLVSLQNLYGLAPEAMNTFLKKGEKATTTFVNLKLIGERRNRLKQRQRKLTLKEIRDAKRHAKINGTGGVNVVDDLVNTSALYSSNVNGTADDVLANDDHSDDKVANSSSSSSPQQQQQQEKESDESSSTATPARRLSDMFNRVTSHIKGEAEKFDARFQQTVKEECKKVEDHHKKWTNILKSGKFSYVCITQHSSKLL